MPFAVVMPGPAAESGLQGFRGENRSVEGRYDAASRHDDGERASKSASLPNVLSVPLEAVTSDGGFSWVYKKEGRNVVKQMVETGALNDNEIIGAGAACRRKTIVLLQLPPTDKTDIRDGDAIPGLKPATTAEHDRRRHNAKKTSIAADGRRRAEMPRGN